MKNDFNRCRLDVLLEDCAYCSTDSSPTGMAGMVVPFGSGPVGSGPVATGSGALVSVSLMAFDVGSGARTGNGEEIPRLIYPTSQEQKCRP